MALFNCGVNIFDICDVCGNTQDVEVERYDQITLIPVFRLMAMRGSEKREYIVTVRRIFFKMLYEDS